MTRKFSYLIIFMLILSAFACTKSTESYLFSRPTNPNNFRTVQQGELYAYTQKDSALSRADYYMRVKGYLVNYGEGRILKYGHCWCKKGATPNISDEKLMTQYTDPIPAVGDSIPFESSMTNLESGTPYNVASYVVIETEKDGEVISTVGYNPNVAEIKTKPAIDEWFEQYPGCPNCPDAPDGNLKPSPSARFDAVAFNFGDTLFYGTGGQGHGGLNNTILMYNPDTKQWDNEFQIKFPEDYKPNATVNYGMMDGIGFAIEYQRKGDPPGQLTRSIFIGFGDYGGEDNVADKSNFLLEYNLSKNEGWVVRGRNFTNGRSGAVCFVLNGKAYIGTGSHVHNETESNWFVYDPVAATDNSNTDANGNANYDGKGFEHLQANNTPKAKRKGAIAFVLNGKGYFGLGTDGKGTFYKDFWSFKPNKSDPTLGSWDQLKDYPGEKRANAVSFTIGDLAYVGTGDNLTAKVSNDTYFMETAGEWEGEIFNDFYRYNPYTNTWRKVADYTSNKGKNEEENRKDAIRPITRAVGFSSDKRKIGFVGYGLVPPGYEIKNPPHQQANENSPAQEDFWKYQPFNAGAK